MKFEKVMGILLVLNLGLVGYLVWSIAGNAPSSVPQPTRAGASGPRPKTVFVTNRVEVPATNAFHWSQLESDDYRDYIANLRAAGCPPQTIRDIIIADLDLLWAPRIRGLMPRRELLEYWHSEEAELANNVDAREVARLERAVDREKRDVIRELIGIDLAAERMRLQGKEDPLERRLGFLSADQVMNVRDLTERYAEEEWAVLEKQWTEGQPLSAEDRRRLQELRDLRSEELNGILSPEERARFDLWMSPAAATVRHDMYGMNATEQEFLKVYELQKAFQEKWSPDLVALDDPQAMARWDEARSALDDRIRAALGEDRYAEYARGSDETFHLLNAAVTRYGLDRAKAAEVYAMRRTASDVRETVMGNTGLTDQQKQAALEAVDRETRRAMREALGERAYNYFRRREDWLQSQR